ncbi:hypothetical protein DSO57_1006678 [Entomophthora muscae]|uniref:Uncharacterized protein n=1 Tax=Entomophthora muscae TaxID=34485 RepID=A0ACC2TIC1_9FUNG|nr:hypothetical protein DSO57_1006678 [Entomophthora muscae]
MPIYQKSHPSSRKKMNHLILLSVLTACIGLGGHQSSFDQTVNMPGTTEDMFYKDQPQLASSNISSWPPLVSPRSTMSLAVYTSVYYFLTYFYGNFGRYNVLSKAVCWLMTIYPIVTALTRFQFFNLLPYLSQLMPHILMFYTQRQEKTPVKLTRTLLLMRLFILKI